VQTVALYDVAKQHRPLREDRLREAARHM
jgi:hypothetical protein